MWIEHATIYNCWVTWNHVYSPFNIFQRCQIYAHISHEFSSAEELQSLKIRGICENLIFSFQLKVLLFGQIWDLSEKSLFTGWSKQLLKEVFDTNLKFYIPISLQPDIISLYPCNRILYPYILATGYYIPISLQPDISSLDS